MFISQSLFCVSRPGSAALQNFYPPVYSLLQKKKHGLNRCLVELRHKQVSLRGRSQNLAGSAVTNLGE